MFQIPGSKIQFLDKFYMKIERFEDLEIWQEAREQCEKIFEITLVDNIVEVRQLTLNFKP